MTDDRLNNLKEDCEKDVAAGFPGRVSARDVLNLIDMVQNYGAEIDRLNEVINRLIKSPWEVYYSDKMIDYRTAEVGAYIKMLEEEMEK